ncbi:MAG: hypothetical protein H9W81_12840 [Enterococcus sp.]|nr:hypothetical protein [Enterococcus sp.]
MEKFLRGTKASLITLSQDVNDPSARKPAIGVFASLSEGDAPMGLKSTRNSISAFVIQNIAPVSPKAFDGRVKVFFFAPSRNDKKTPIEYSFVIPVQYVASAMSLSALDEPLGGLPFAFFDSGSAKLNEKITLDIHDADFFLTFPMKESQESLDLSDKLSALIDSNYTVPLAPVPWDAISSGDGMDFNDYPNLNTAQGIMFNHLIAMARGDIGALMEIMAMEPYIDDSYGDVLDYGEDEESETEPEVKSDNVISKQLEDIEDSVLLSDMEDESEDEEEDEEAQFAEQIEEAKYRVFPLCATIAETMLTRIQGHHPRIKGILAGSPETIGSDEYEPQVDLEFDALTSSLEDIFKGKTFGEESREDIQRKQHIEYWEAPIEESVPSMKPLFDYIDTLPDKDDYRKLLNLDLLNEKPGLGEISTYPVGKMFTAMAIQIAAYALKKSTILSHLIHEILPVPEIISSWILINNTDFVWELPSLAHSLSQYNVANAVDVLSMHYKPSNDLENAIYLWNSIYVIAEMFENNAYWANMPKEEFRARLDKLENKTPEFLKFKKWLKSFFDVIKDDDHTASAEKQSETHQAIHEFFESEEDITVLATHVAMAFIAFADMIVMDQEITPDNPEWNARRLVVLNHMLTNVAEHTGKRIEIAIR